MVFLTLNPWCFGLEPCPVVPFDMGLPASCNVEDMRNTGMEPMRDLGLSLFSVSLGPQFYINT